MYLAAIFFFPLFRDSLGPMQAANQTVLNLAYDLMTAVGLGVTATIRVGIKRKRTCFDLRRIATSIFVQVFLLRPFCHWLYSLEGCFTTFYIDNIEVEENGSMATAFFPT
jgi:hypothetical protein